MSKKISDLTAAALSRLGDLFETVQSSSSLKVALGNMPFQGGDIPPASANALDDEFKDSSTLSSWTWNNQGGATAAITNGMLNIVAPVGTGNNQRTLEKSAPSTPWTVTTKIALNACPGQNYSTVGFFLRDTTSGRCYGWGPIHDTNDNLSLFKYSSNTAVSSVALAVLAPWAKTCYLRVRDDGTNVYFDHSMDGVNFANCFNEARLTYLTSGISKIGLYACSNNSTYPCIGSFKFFRVLPS